jgi:hypothetical protein
MKIEFTESLLHYQILPPIVILVVIYVVLAIYKKYKTNKKVRSPFTDEALLRLPGHSLFIQIQKLSDTIDTQIVELFLGTIIIVNSIVLSISEQGLKGSAVLIIVALMALIIFFCWQIFKFVKNINHRGELRLGYEGELVTAQELMKLMPEGNYVYHDFQADKFNIDHIVVGPAGVFAIETKAKSKKMSGDNRKDAKAIYNGQVISFPDFNDTKYLDQAKRQAKWLSKWLESSTGEGIDVFPVVSLPGWFVERKAPYDGMYVINPKNFKNVIQSKKKNILTEQRVKQIVHQVDRKCRDIEIQSKQYDKK